MNKERNKNYKLMRRYVFCSDVSRVFYTKKVPFAEVIAKTARSLQLF